MTKHLIALTLLLLDSLTPLHAEGTSKPNVVYIMADDIGWGDISAHGGGVPTPNIDGLFSKGVELTQFMGWCVCSPTRAMLLTGRHPIRVGTGPETGGELDPAETTIAEGFKANGYRTGVFGKWHNGNDPETPEFRAHFAEANKDKPNKKAEFGHGANAHGFDEAWVYYGGGPDYFTRRTVKGAGPVSWWHNREFRPQDEGYVSSAGDHAVQAVCVLSGPCDMQAMVEAARDPNRRTAMESLFGTPLKDKAELIRSASPITQITRESPPFLILHGEQDEVVPAALAQRFHEALSTQATQSSRLIVLPNTRHDIFRNPQWADEAITFFEATVKLALPR